MQIMKYLEFLFVLIHCLAHQFDSLVNGHFCIFGAIDFLLLIGIDDCSLHFECVAGLMHVDLPWTAANSAGWMTIHCITMTKFWMACK